MKGILIGLVRLYQLFLAPVLRLLNGGHGHCRHQPTCSNYAVQALRVHGALKGSALTARRLLRCHPWGTHGYDPVPPAKASKDSDRTTAQTTECAASPVPSCCCAKTSADP